MSGTSLDGIDAALVDLRPRGSGYAFTLLASDIVPFRPALRAAIVAALPPERPSVHQSALLDKELGRVLGEAVAQVAQGQLIDYVASHGLTLYHAGSERVSVQIGDPFVIREHVGVTVIADFRRADCAAGGQGAPLVPYVDALLFTGGDQETVAVNVGGIANLTLVPGARSARALRAWDCGPGNMLLDTFVSERTGGVECYDRAGAYARAGHARESLVQEMLADGYFAKLPPKSTGREYFGAAFFARHHAALASLSLQDGCATLLALTVASIACSIDENASRNARVVVSGGGARNPMLVDGLRKRSGGRCVLLATDLGIDGDMKEALAFAILGYETLRGRPAGVPQVTGATHAALLGAIVPSHLGALLAKVECEVREA